MKDSFRQSMSWLHTWCGLTCGWLLCAIFLAGTLSVFREPITRWMEARPALPAAHSGPASSATSSTTTADPLAPAVHYLAQHAAQARAWIITLPAQSGDAVLLSWRAANAGGGGKAGMQQAALDPASGAVLPSPWGRATEGGRHFMSFHYMLHAGIPGFWVVGWVAMCALVALISGVVVHKRIFKDFFTFRPGKGQRSWLDAHNVSAVLALPFLFMIVYTGLSYFYSSYVPLPLRAVYGDDTQAYQRFQNELTHADAANAAAAATGKTGNVSSVAPTSAQRPDLTPLLQQARALTGGEIRRIVVEQAGKPGMKIRLLGDGTDHDSTAILNQNGVLLLEAASGKIVQLKKSGPPEKFSSEHIHGVLERLHIASFGGWGIKWLYFLSGLMGSVMIATGTLLFAVKRQKKSLMEFGAGTALVYRCVDVLNIAAIIGTCLACVGYFYANRLIPADLAGRAQLEISAFFYVWLASLLHAALRPAGKAWIEQLAATAALCLALPLLNWLSTGQQLGFYLLRGDWQRAGVELTALGFGLLFLLILRRLATRTATNEKAQTARSAREGNA